MFDKITARSKGFFYGWWMVAVGCGMRMLGGGFHLYGFTIFFLPITQELGLTRAATSLVFSLARAEGAIEDLAERVRDRGEVGAEDERGAAWPVPTRAA